MKTRQWKRALIVLSAGVLLFGVVACDASAERTGCKNTSAGAEYTIEITNDDNDASAKVQLIVGSESRLAKARRHGTEVTVAAGHTVTKKVTVTKAQGTRDVRVFWPAPKGNDTFIYSEVLASSCP